ncbi:Platelet endothelial cell adhesion molecule [Takifugu flavidus]|uniref:Platelet endothelial cell adhesion molecule n=1 Tax=Takifugu flavidus TaxID=433684 RepID=A0A5C6MY43_9TELE|nr:Platelet endothelial cell adhesion molecule [Takifugu flavidus]
MAVVCLPGLAEPTLQLNKGVVSEGEEITATCSAPGETGSIFFYFYDNSTDVAEQHENSNQTKVKFHLSSVGVHKIHCRYSVLLTPGSQDSEVSNGVTVTVKELPIVPVLEVAPEHQIFEGDPLTVRCYINAQHQLPGGVELYLSQGSRLLSHGAPSINHSMVALAQQPGELECKLEMGNVVKVARKTIAVIGEWPGHLDGDSPVRYMVRVAAAVFQRELMTLTCRSEHVAPERLSREQLSYSLVPAEHLLYPGAKGVFTGKALGHHFNYTCAAEAKGIVKHSQTLTVRPKGEEQFLAGWVWVTCGSAETQTGHRGGEPLMDGCGSPVAARRHRQDTELGRLRLHPAIIHPSATHHPASIHPAASQQPPAASQAASQHQPATQPAASQQPASSQPAATQQQQAATQQPPSSHQQPASSQPAANQQPPSSHPAASQQPASSTPAASKQPASSHPEPPSSQPAASQQPSQQHPAASKQPPSSHTSSHPAASSQPAATQAARSQPAASSSHQQPASSHPAAPSSQQQPQAASQQATQQQPEASQQPASSHPAASQQPPSQHPASSQPAATQQPASIQTSSIHPASQQPPAIIQPASTHPSSIQHPSIIIHPSSTHPSSIHHPSIIIHPSIIHPSPPPSNKGHRVAVSLPKISVEGRAILGRPVKILCESDSGSLPINYTLLKGYDKLDTVEVRLPSERAVFMVTISSPAEMSRFMCKASNGPKDPSFSGRLNTTVVEPLSDATLTVIPNLSEISEGDHLYLICGVKGSPPITFKWYRSGQATPVHTAMADKNHTDFQIPLLSKDHSGEYYCEAINYANFIHSEPVIIAVRLALWKKALIGVVGLLAASVLVLVCVLCFRAKRGRETYSPTESQASFVSKLHEKSAAPSSCSSSHVSSPVVGAAALYDGTEGRVTNGVRDSAASLPADISNRSSYSIPATV